METAILVIWWVGLIGAWLAILVILSEVFQVLGTLQGILRLAELTRDAAHGLIRHVHAVEQLGEVGEPRLHFQEATGALAARATAVAQAIDAIAGVRREEA